MLVPIVARHDLWGHGALYARTTSSAASHGDPEAGTASSSIAGSSLCRPLVDSDVFARAGTGGDLEAGTAGSSTAGGSITAGQQTPPDGEQACTDKEPATFDRELGDSETDEGWLGQDPVDEEEQSSAEEHGCGGAHGTGQQQGPIQHPQQLTFGNPQAELVARGLEAGLRKGQSGLSAASGTTRSSRRPRREPSGLSGGSSRLAAALDGFRGGSRRLRQQQAGPSDASGAGRVGERRSDDEEQRSSRREERQDEERQDDVLTTGQSSEVSSQGGGIWPSCCVPLTIDTYHSLAPWHQMQQACCVYLEVRLSPSSAAGTMGSSWIMR